MPWRQQPGDPIVLVLRQTRSVWRRSRIFAISSIQPGTTRISSSRQQQKAHSPDSAALEVTMATRGQSSGYGNGGRAGQKSPPMHIILPRIVLRCPARSCAPWVVQREHYDHLLSFASHSLREDLLYSCHPWRPSPSPPSRSRRAAWRGTPEHCIPMHWARQRVRKRPMRH